MSDAMMSDEEALAMKDAYDIDYYGYAVGLEWEDVDCLADTVVALRADVAHIESRRGAMLDEIDRLQRELASVTDQRDELAEEYTERDDVVGILGGNVEGNEGIDLRTLAESVRGERDAAHADIKRALATLERNLPCGGDDRKCKCIGCDVAKILRGEK